MKCQLTFLNHSYLVAFFNHSGFSVGLRFPVKFRPNLKRSHSKALPKFFFSDYLALLDLEWTKTLSP